ncbi:MAG: SIR2 family protein [Bacteroidaceae bacterium]|nr:SIR2 family protein [Bacteroidaceae bacterium]
MAKRPQTLFIGNGFNRNQSDDFEWSQVLNTGTELIVPRNLPYTHLYEKLYLPSTEEFFERKDETEFKAGIIRHLDNLMSKFPYEQFPEKYLNLFDGEYCPYQNIITTNYDYGIERALEHIGYIFQYEKNREEKYSTYRRKCYKKGEQTVIVWHIHGEGHGKGDSPKSIMLGYDHYCATTSRIQSYVKNGVVRNYVVNKELKEKHRETKIHYMPFIMEEQGRNWDPASITTWIDTFFFSDMHIIGFGMDFSEIDIWWILNKRKRYLTDESSSHYVQLKLNDIYFYDYASEAILKTLKAYDVVFDTNRVVKPDEKDVDWNCRLKQSIRSLKKRMKETE